MAVTGYKFGGNVVVDTAIGTNGWDNDGAGTPLSTNRLSADDGNYAYNICNATEISYYLKATDFGFTTSDIPNGSTINGVEMRYRRFRDAGSFTIVNTTVRIVIGGTVSGNNIGNTVDWATSEESALFGSASELGGLSISESDIVGNANFGCAISLEWNTGRIAAGFAFVDSVEIRVNYTTGGGGATSWTPWRSPHRFFKRR